MTATIKKYLIIAGIAIAAIISGLIVYGNYQRALYVQSVGASKVLTAEYNALKKTSDAAILAKTQEINALIKEKQAAIADANKHALGEAVIQSKYEALKRETASLPADALSRNINARIGSGNSWPTAGGLFSFTRSGVDNTLNLFLDGEGYKAKFENERGVSLNLRAAVDAAEREGVALIAKYDLKDGEYMAAVAAWDADKESLSHLRKSILGRRVKSFIIGGAIGVVTGIIIYHFFIKPDNNSAIGTAVTIKNP
jgi:Arc/MetJ family transcription regulator